MMATVPHPPVDPAVADRLAKSFAAREAKLVAALAAARADFDHKGVRGNDVEGEVRAFLRAHLSRRLDVGHGEVIDRFGGRSPQLDVVVLNEDQPFVNPPETDGLYLAEGVTAIGEVKSLLDTGALRDIIAKGKRIRSLRPTPLKGDLVQSNPSDIRRFVSSFPYFALAMESKLKAEPILAKLRAEPDVPGPPEADGTLPPLDALFVVGVGVFLNMGDGQGAFRVYGSFGESQTGWVMPRNQEVIANLFIWLHAVTPRITRRQSITLPYLVALEQGPDS